jgi:uncharacterized protein YfaS (alpha-2-macroglobulin family)
LRKILTLTLQTEAGRPWYSLTLAGVPLKTPAPENHGLELSKTYSYHATSVAFLDSPDFKPITLNQGDLIEVTLHLSSKTSLSDVVVSDLFPGGLEFCDVAENAIGHVEPREDRLIWVIPKVDLEASLSYTLRAVTPGEFVLPPARAEGMYQNEFFSILPEGKVIILKKDAANSTNASALP